MVPHDEIVHLAKKIDDLHRGQASEWIMSEDQNVVSLYGEFKFSEYWGDGLYPQIHDGSWGDKGKDFTISLYWAGDTKEFTVDVKSARRPIWMPVNPAPTEKKCRAKPIRADIYVFAGANPDQRKAWLVGWAWKEKIENEVDAPIIDNAGYGIYARTLMADKLWTMDDLYSIRHTRTQKSPR
jgi:hypothetical protein